MNQNRDFNKKIKEEVDKNQKGYNSQDEEETFTVSTVEELIEVLNQVHEKQIVILLQGEYILPEQYNMPNCKIIGEDKETTIVKNYGFNFGSTSHEDIEIANITFDGNGVDRGDSGFIQCIVEANIHIHDCVFTNMTGKWNCHGIRIAKTFPDYSIEIDNCEFTGSNSITGYGHTYSSIAGYHNDFFYNLDIHNNVFNHPKSSTHVPMYEGIKAIALFNNYKTGRTINSKAYCNEYLGEFDRNLGIEESECTQSENTQEPQVPPTPTPNTVTYSFTSYADQEGETEWATGTVQTTGVTSNGYTEVEVKTNSPYEEFIGQKFYIISTAEADNTTLYELYTDAGTTSAGIYVKISNQA